jgi:Ser-tRNA(Ala) deacylase AlaX
MIKLSMHTKLLYLDDSYLKECKCKIVSFDELGNNRYRLVLDQTVFYPIGGGQACDQGTLSNDSWKATVQEVVIKDGEVRHIVLSDTPPTVGLELNGVINWNRRFKLMKIHSAGHVVDWAMFMLGYCPRPLMPYKGDHGKKAFVGYMGEIQEDIKEKLEQKSNELITKKLSITWEFVSYEQLQKDAIYLQSDLPTNKPLRKITLEGVGSVADGGTQVKNTSEIGKIIITSITSQGGETKVEYRVE